MSRLDLIMCSEEELARVLLPIDDQMNNSGVPMHLRAIKGWQLVEHDQQLDLPLHDPATVRIMEWFRTHVRIG